MFIFSTNSYKKNLEFSVLENFYYCSKQLGDIMHLVGNNHVVDNTCNRNERKEMENYNFYNVGNMKILSNVEIETF